MAVAPVSLTQLGIGKEPLASKGTAVAATDLLPVAIDKLSPHDKVAYLEDMAARGSMAELYDEIQGIKDSEFGFGGPVFADVIAWAVAGIFGEVATTGAGPFVHVCTLLNSGDGQPNSYSLTDFYGMGGGTPAKRYKGMQFSELGFKWAAEGMFEYDAKLVGFASGLVAKPVLTIPTTTPFPGWECVAQINGTPVLSVEAFEFSLKRKADPIHGSGGTQDPWKVLVGALGITGKATIMVEDETQMGYYLNNTQPAFDVVFSHAAGAQAITLHATKAAFTDATYQRGKSATEISVEFACKANTTDVGASGGLGPGKITVTNGKAAGTYTG